MVRVRVKGEGLSTLGLQREGKPREGAVEDDVAPLLDRLQQ